MNQAENDTPFTEDTNESSESDLLKAAAFHQASTAADSSETPAVREDHVSDPALSDETGHDWSDEGGATEQGPAAGNEEATPDS